MLDTATELEFNSEFIRITVGPPPIELSEDVIKDLSTNQSYAYQMIKVIRDGRDHQAAKKKANLEIGPVCHSRWLPTALRFSRIWIGHHGLKKRSLRILD